MKDYQYIVEMIPACRDNLEKQDELLESFVKLALEKEDDQPELVELFESLPGEVATLVAYRLSRENYRYLYAWHCLNRSNHFGSRSLRSLRNFREDNTDANDWDAIEELLTQRLSLVFCESCDEWEYGSRTTTVHDGTDVCRECLDEYYRWSDYEDAYLLTDDCRTALDEEGDEVLIHYENDNFRFDDELDQYVHYDYEPPEPTVIGNYHSSKGYHRPQPSPWTRMKKRYLGVELEVEIKREATLSRTEKAKLLHDKLNDNEHGRNVFFENDGSLNNGFEIITQPMGLDKHKELWQWLSDRDAVRGLISHNTTTCGLHVHVSKAGLSKLQIAKIVSFVNDPDNEELIRAVARRYAEGYCRIKAKKIGQSAQSEDRYEAVNITPRNTIEFRIFKGSLKYESVMSAIQFSNALVEFCARATTSVQDLKTDKFLEFMAKVVPEDTDVVRPYITQRLETA